MMDVRRCTVTSGREPAATAGTAGDIVLALVADEEHASIGTEAVLDHLGLAPDAPLHVPSGRAVEDREYVLEQ